MRQFASRLIFAAAIFVFSFQAALATDQQMLPPTDPGINSPCSTGGDKVLILHDDGTGGKSAINCNGSLTADPSTGSVTISPTNSTSTSPALIVGGNGGINAPGFYYTGSGGCTDCGGGPPPPPLPVCDGPNQVLQSNGSSYSCVTIGGGGTPLTARCAPGMVLRAIVNDVPQCVSAGGGGTPIADMTCPAGQGVTGFSGGSPVCTLLPGAGAGAPCDGSVLNDGYGFGYPNSQIPSGYIVYDFQEDGIPISNYRIIMNQCQNGSWVQFALSPGQY